MTFVDAAAPAPPRTQDRLRLALVANLVLQAVIIVTGGLVRLTGSGLGCPTWPQCTPGSFTPVAQQEQGWHVFVEFGNRLMTFVLTAVAVWLLVGAVRRALRDPGPANGRFAALAAVPLLGILAQAVVGGIIVLTKLDPKTVSPHFLLSVVLVAYSAWLLVRYDEGAGPHTVTVSPVLRRLALLAAGAFALAMCLGTAVTGSGPHSGDADEPLRFGFDPVLTSRLHSASVWVFVAALVGIAILARRGPGAPAAFVRAWTSVLHLSLVQGAIGYAQYVLGLPIALVAVHMLISAALTALVTFGVTASRRPVNQATPPRVTAH